MPSTKVLSVGINPELLWLREAVLRSAGFDVITSLDPKDGLSRIGRTLRRAASLLLATVPITKAGGRNLPSEMPSRSDRHNHERKRSA